MTRDAALLRAAVDDNVAWCDAVALAHGVPTTRTVDVWRAAATMPEYYPVAATLRPGVRVARSDLVAGAVKDSYADLALGEDWEVIIEAEWIGIDGAGPTPERPGGWSRIGPADADAWRGRHGIPAAVVAASATPGVHLLELVGGVAAAVLTEGPGAVGVGNVAVAAGPDDAAWDGVLAAARSIAAGRPIVGYEWGAALDAARTAGFRSVGALRVLAPRAT